jgi:hypothetical protein
MHSNNWEIFGDILPVLNVTEAFEDMGMGKICPVSIKIAVMLVFIAIEIY